VPAGLGLDAADYQGNGNILFSTRSNGWLGSYYLYQNNVYERYASTGAIGVALNWSALGLNVQNLDAVDRLADGSFAFSTETNQTVGPTYLRNENVYRVFPATGTIVLLFSGNALGLRDLDGVDVYPDGRVAFSTSTNFGIYGGSIYLSHEDIYVYTPSTGTVVKHFDGSQASLDTLDAFAVGAGLE
jgi:hypothetical protein